MASRESFTITLASLKSTLLIHSGDMSTRLPGSQLCVSTTKKCKLHDWPQARVLQQLRPPGQGEGLVTAPTLSGFPQRPAAAARCARSSPDPPGFRLVLAL